MTAIVVSWTAFAVLGILILFAGPELSRSGDIIAELTGLSGSWIGILLLATVTSLPELATGISSVSIAQAPNVAVGDALGSCVFNLAILVVLDALQKESSIYQRIQTGHVLSAGFGVILIGFIGVNILLGQMGRMVAFGYIGAYTPVIILLYLFAVRTIFTYERNGQGPIPASFERKYPTFTLTRALLRFALSGILVVMIGVALPFVAMRIADAMHWNKSFVGTLFAAMLTSLPELVVTVAASRIGALDMAIANLLGSNLFDCLILAIDDLFYKNGPLLSHIAQSHVITVMSAIVMTGIGIVGIFYRPRARMFGMVGWIGLGLFLMYLFNAIIIYLHGE